MTINSTILPAIITEAMDIAFFKGPSKRVLSRMKGSGVHQFIVVTGGVYKATVDARRSGEIVRAEAGDVVLWPGGTDHTDESEEGRPLRCVVIWLRWSKAPTHLPFKVRDSEHIITLLAHRLLALAHEPARKSVLGAEADALGSAIFAEFILRAKITEDELLSKVAIYTEEHINKPIRLDDLARCVGLEKHHFGRKYKQLTGRTPIQDIKRRKAAYAKHILQMTPTNTLSNIGSFVGVKDVATLSRLLSRHVGASARDIKHAARTKQS